MHLAMLNSALLPRNFTRVLAVVWAGALFELAAQVDAPVGDRPPVFHDRLAEALDILTDFFHAEGKGTIACLRLPPYTTYSNLFIRPEPQRH